MSREKITIKCGKPTGRCRQDPKYLHGPYYRWTGWINGRGAPEQGDAGGVERVGGAAGGFKLP